MKRNTLNHLMCKSKSRRIILDKVFSNFYSLKDMTLDKAVAILTPFKGEIAAELKYLKLLTILNGWETDDRSGEETYGYQDDEDILINLQYVSDRYSAEFRLQWVLDLIDKYKN